jgi:hypothetical protein
MTRRTPLVAVTAGLLTAAACSGGSKIAITPTTGQATTTTTAPTTSAVRATTTTPTARYALTGLPVTNRATAGRPALVVKIDNIDAAVPQTGLNQADVVYEEIVEGVTRLFVVFQSADSTPVGPIRSARTTDVNLVAGLSEPLFAYAGGNRTVTRQIANADLTDVGYNNAYETGGYYRDRLRRAPHNLYADTVKLFALAPKGQGAPAPLFTFRPAGAASTAGAATTGVKLSMAGTNVQYIWDPGTRTWQRDEYGEAHKDATGVQIAPANVIVQFVSYVGVPGVPESQQAVSVGEGEAWIFTDGHLVKGKWSRPDPARPAIYTDAAGKVVALTPGRTWVELPKPGDAVDVPPGVDPGSVPYPRY